jgi:hypothetical protein
MALVFFFFFFLIILIFLFKDLDLEYKKKRHPSETLTKYLELIYGENDEKTTGSKQQQQR